MTFRLPVLIATVSALVAAPVEPAWGDIATGPLADRACARVTHEQLLRTWRGVHPARSGEILIVPDEPNFVNGGLSHAGPWDYLQRVPLLLYGPGYIRNQGSVARPVNVGQIPATIAELLGYEGFDPPIGGMLGEALVDQADRPEPPKIVMFVVWDAGGRNVLSRWPGSWKNLAGMIPGGTWYENARLGTSPSVTPPLHSTFGTGAWPSDHGMTDNVIRLPSGAIVDAWKFGPKNLLLPTLSDLYDEAMGNEPLVAAIAHESRHLGMMGHGSQYPDGDQDVAATHGHGQGFSWTLPAVLAPFYDFPGYVNGVGGVGADLQTLDLADGEDDEAWRNHSFTSLDDGFNTPARLPYQARVIERMIDTEGFGDDDVPDLFWTNFKLIDGTAHRFGMNSLEEKDTVLWTDRQLPALRRMLDEAAGPGNWVLILTADHGANPENPAAFPIRSANLASDLARAFDDGDATKLIQQIRPTQIFVNKTEAAQLGVTMAEIATFLNAYTEGANRSGRPTATVQAASSQVFDAAIPRSMISRLACLPEARA
jgi:hypothetical protein